MTRHEAEHPIDAEEPSEPSISLTHITRALRKYRRPILLTALAATLGYLVLALVLYLKAPSYEATTQAFRLDFKGAEKGEYPNGVKFGSSDIISAPILQKVFAENNLGQYLGFAEFTRSIYILEANPAYPPLAAEYTQRLADPKLSPVDRDRIRDEFESKKASLAKNAYAITWVRHRGTRVIPIELVHKTLLGILREWARFASMEQRVLDYRLSVLSPDIVNPTAIEEAHPIVSVLSLRKDANRVMANVEELERVPGAEMLRTKKERASLAELHLQLDEIIRLRIDPLIAAARASGLVQDVGATIEYIESQLAHSERALVLLQNQADVIRQSILIYTDRQSLGNEGSQAATDTPVRSARQPRVDTDQTSTYLTDSFIDRLVTLTTQTSDQKFRQDLAKDYRAAMETIGPAQQEVAYDRAVLERLRESRPGFKATPESVKADIARTRSDVREVIVRMNEIHQLLSSTLNASSQLLTISGQPVTRLDRGIDGSRLLFYAPLVFLLALFLAAVSALLYNRLRQEQEAEVHHQEHAS